MGGGSGKGGQQVQEIELPEEITGQAKKNLKLAEQVGSLPYAPYFGPSVAAFSPTQEAAFKNTNAAASAFGLPTSSGTGLPKAKDFGGFKGYSTEGLYNDAMNRVPKDVRRMYDSFFQGFGQQAAAPVGAGAGGGMDYDAYKRYQAADRMFQGGDPMNAAIGNALVNNQGVPFGKGEIPASAFTGK